MPRSGSPFASPHPLGHSGGHMLDSGDRMVRCRVCVGPCGTLEQVPDRRRSLRSFDYPHGSFVLPKLLRPLVVVDEDIHPLIISLSQPILNDEHTVGECTRDG